MPILLTKHGQLDNLHYEKELMSKTPLFTLANFGAGKGGTAPLPPPIFYRGCFLRHFLP